MSNPTWRNTTTAPMPARRRPPNGTAVAGFVAALVGLVFLVPLFGWLALPFVLLGLGLSIYAYLKARGGADRRGLALPGLVMAAATLVLGTIVNLVTYHRATVNWTAATPAAVAPSGPQAEAVIGDWEVNGTPVFRFTPDGIAENLDSGERFNWNGDGTFSNASVYETWQVAGDTLVVTAITGDTIEYTRAR